jgi:predicted dehydrogenase
MSRPLRVGLVGCGRISGIYLRTLSRFPQLEVAACASLDLAESRAVAMEHDVPRACQPGELLADDDIDCVLNLTIPAAHFDISAQALESGKHVYAEKPFVTRREDGERLLQMAAERDLYLGNAPDTFLGGRWQTVKKLLDSGTIGRPTAVSAFVGTRGVERHHPNPDFYYQPGGGPLLDLGPYYFAAMVFLLGPIGRVCGMARRAFDERLIESQPRAGERIPVQVDTHVQTLFEFASGVQGSMTISFDIWESETPRFEIYGEDGTICIADPDPVHGANIFQGEVWYRTRETSRWVYQPRVPGNPEWQIAKNTHGHNEDSRGLGLVDMALAICEQRAARCSGTLAMHLFDVMQGVLDSAERGEFIDIASRCTPPAALPETFP